MNIIKRFLKGCELAKFTIEMEKGFYTNNLFDKLMIYYHFVKDSIRGV